MSCPFKDIFGKPGEGVHSIRFMNIAVVDTLATLGLAWGISKYTQWNIWVIFILLIIVSIPIHKLFCVKTTLSSLV